MQSNKYHNFILTVVTIFLLLMVSNSYGVAELDLARKDSLEVVITSGDSSKKFEITITNIDDIANEIFPNKVEVTITNPEDIAKETFHKLDGMSMKIENPEEGMNMQDWILLITVFLAAGATVAAWIAAIQTRKSALGTMLTNLISNYGSKEMLNSLILLRDWKDNQGEDFAKIFAEIVHGKKELPEYERKVNESRRRVFTFYETLRVLEKRKILSEDDIKEIIGRHAVNIFFEIVEPLEDEMAKIDGRIYWKEPFTKVREWIGEVSDD